MDCCARVARTSRRIRARSPSRRSRSACRPGRPVIFIGLDGADWDLLDRYIAHRAHAEARAAGRAKERAGRSRRIHPPLSPLIWNSMMTGVSPVEHRILDFFRFYPATRQKEPITSDERRAPAVWNMAVVCRPDQRHLRLWATYPAERVSGRWCPIG